MSDSFAHAAGSLARCLPDVVLEAVREEWGNTNVAVIKKWRDDVLRYDAHAPEAHALVRRLLNAWLADAENLGHPVSEGADLVKQARAYLAAVEGRNAQNK